MAEHDVPEDLVALKVAFWAAEGECAVLAARPEAAEPDVQEQARAELNDATVGRLKIVTDMYAHEWWATQPNRYEADQAVNKAAKAAGGVRP